MLIFDIMSKLLFSVWIKSLFPVKIKLLHCKMVLSCYSNMTHFWTLSILYLKKKNNANINVPECSTNQWTPFMVERIIIGCFSGFPDTRPESPQQLTLLNGTIYINSLMLCEVTELYCVVEKQTHLAGGVGYEISLMVFLSGDCL